MRSCARVRRRQAGGGKQASLTWEAGGKGAAYAKLLGGLSTAGHADGARRAQVTYNGGARWQDLNQPEHFRFPECNRCAGSRDPRCQLHLHGPSSWHDGVGAARPRSGAVGVMGAGALPARQGAGYARTSLAHVAA